MRGLSPPASKPPRPEKADTLAATRSLVAALLAATGFDARTVAGGIVATAGLVLNGTVVGAVAGVPLTVIGGVMAAVGTVGRWMFGDNDMQKYARKLGCRD